MPTVLLSLLANYVENIDYWLKLSTTPCCILSLNSNDIIVILGNITLLLLHGNSKLNSCLYSRRWGNSVFSIQTSNFPKLNWNMVLSNPWLFWGYTQGLTINMCLYYADSYTLAKWCLRKGYELICKVVIWTVCPSYLTHYQLPY